MFASGLTATYMLTFKMSTSFPELFGLS
ncbi:hypothetical protein SBV1_1450032 [Verrucomicrobia bacterium]|nr:hypothetical protein SBV1_1450032 [Verrucomicrobiota bacterium]